MVGCVADTNARDGLRMLQTTGTGTMPCMIKNSTFYKNTVDSIHTMITSGAQAVLCLNNIIYGNGGTTIGIECDTASVSSNWFQFNNAFGNNNSNRLLPPNKWNL